MYRLPKAHVLAIVGMGVYVFHMLRYGSWLVDDAGISIAYAKNIVSGVGLVAQPGAARVEGFSNPLWTFLLALLPLRHTSLIVPSIKLASVALVYASMMQVTAIARRVVDSPRLAMAIALATNVICAFNPSFVIWTSSGLENPLYVLLVLLLCRLGIAVAAEAMPRARRLAVNAGIVAALVTLTRPDGVLYAGVALVACLSNPASVRDRVRLVLRLSTGGVLLFGPFLFFRVLYFSDVVPNTYHAKPGVSLWRGVTFLTDPTGFTAWVSLCESLFGVLAVLAVALLLGYPVYAFMRDRDQCGRARRVLWMTLAVSVCIFLALPSDWMPEYRFATPFFPLALLCVFAGADFISSDLGTTRSNRRRLAVITALFMAITATTFPGYMWRSYLFSLHPTLPMEEVAASAHYFDRVSEELGIRDASVLSPDIGGLLVFSRARVMDLAGLTDRQIGAVIHRNPGALREHVLGTLKPTYIHVHGYWAQASDFYADARFLQDYAAITEQSRPRAGTREIISGDYVRRDALPGHVMTEELRKRIAARKVSARRQAFPLL